MLVVVAQYTGICVGEGHWRFGPMLPRKVGLYLRSNPNIVVWHVGSNVACLEEIRFAGEG